MKKNKYEISLWEDCIVPNSYKETEDSQLKDDKKYHFYNEEKEIHSAPIMGSLIKTYQSFPQGEWYQKKKDSSGNEIDEYIKAENLNNTDFYYLKENDNYIKVYGKTIYRYKTCVWYELDVLEHYEERKICNIGSDSMTVQWRAREPKLIENINGTNTFTFKMFYSYIDTETGEKKSNPFISQLVNERKVKIKWKNKWYDLIIKSQQEDSNGKSIIYTCKDQFVNELSKTGFQLEFSNELMNNQGTIQELGERVVEGTDWKIDVVNSSIIKQKKEEPVYEALALVDFTSEEGVEIKNGEKFYIFYSIFNNQEKEFFQFWYDETQSFVKQDKSSMLLTSGECLSLENVEWIEGKIITENNIEIDAWNVKYGNNIIAKLSKTADVSDDYRAERLVRSQKSSIDTTINKTVYHYGKIKEDNSIDTDNIIYSFYETEYPDVLMVQNLITNPSDFNYKDSGWNTVGGIVHNAYPLVDDLENDNPSISYIEINPNQLLYNSGIMNHISVIGNSETGTGFVQGDEFIFRYKAKTVNSGNPGTTYENQGDLVPSFYRKLLNTDTNAYEPTGETNFEITEFSQNARWNEYRVKCTKSISYEDLGSWGIFLKNEGSNKRFLQEAQFFKYYLGEPIVQDYDENSSYYEDAVVLYNSTYYQCIRDAKPGIINNSIYWKNIGAAPNEDLKIRINPGSYSTQSYANQVQSFYAAGQQVDDAKKLVYEFKGSGTLLKEWMEENKIVPIYSDNYEKIRSIEAKQSNRFNILQSLAETFQCYIKFEIKHDEATGALVYENGIPQKTITFVEEVGKETGLGFVYGIDLKTISRTITSDNITSKVIVSANNNQYAENGFCTIARATENYPRAEFILNFDYYVTQGLLSKKQVNKDLYSSVEDIGLGYYFNLNKLNIQYDEIEKSLAAKRNELLKQESLLISLQGEEGDGGLIAATNNKIIETKAEICQLASVASWDDDKLDKDLKQETNGNGILDVIDYKNAHPDYTKYQNLFTSCISLQNSLERYVAQKGKLSLSIENLKSLIESQEKKMNNPAWEKEGELPGIVQKKEKLDEKFYHKYSRFIQEGSWASEEYVDDNLYYLDAQSVAYTSSRPQVQYNISVLRLSALEEFKGKEFNLGDISFIEDTEFFGYVPNKLPKTPYREKVLISEVTSVFENPENDSFKVQNYKTQFEDLFQRITATTQSLQYASGEYARAASGFAPTGEITAETLQQSFNRNAELAWSATDDSVTIDNTGITVIDISNPNQIVRLSSDGLQFSNDGGLNFFTGLNGSGINTRYLTSGMINTADITIGDTDNPTFKWDIYGINALGFTTDENGNLISRNTTKFVRFDRFGLYGILANSTESWKPKNEQEVWDNASFSLTWKGFRLKNSYGQGYVSIDSEEDFQVVDSENKQRIKIGNLGTLEEPIYGLTINNTSGKPILIAENGSLWLKDKLQVETYNNNSVQIGKLDGYEKVEIDSFEQNQKYYIYDKNSDNYIEASEYQNDIEYYIYNVSSVHGGRVIHADGGVDENGKPKEFVVYEDGHMKATSGEFTGIINATGGQIGNITIGEVEDAVSSTKKLDIISDLGYNFKMGEENGSPQQLILVASNINFNINSNGVNWYGSGDGLSWTELKYNSNEYVLTYDDFKTNQKNAIYYIKAIATSDETESKNYSDTVTIMGVSDGKKGEKGEDGKYYTVKSLYTKISKFATKREEEVSYTFIPQTFDFEIIKNEGDISSILELNSENFETNFNFVFFEEDYTTKTIINLNNIKLPLSQEPTRFYTKNSVKLQEIANYIITEEDEYEITKDDSRDPNKTYFYKDNTNTFVELEGQNQFQNGVIYYEYADLNDFSLLVSQLKLQEGHLEILFKIKEEGNFKELSLADRIFSIAFGNTDEGARLLVDAEKISSVIGHTSIDMHNGGLTITNGGFYIQKDENCQPLLQFDPKIGEYEKIAEEAKFDPHKEYYIFENDTYIKQENITEFSPDKDYYIVSPGQLEIQGSGIFQGTVYATNGEFNGKIKATEGEFNGKIKATEGEIGGFIIESNRLVSSLKEGNNPYIVLDGTEGKIIAKNIELGEGAKVANFIEFSGEENTENKAFIYNPYNNGGKFIESIYKKGEETYSILINSDATGKIGDIGLDGINSQIYGGDPNSSNYFSITPEKSIFKNVDVTGTIHSSIFETGAIQAVGSSMIFKASSKIINKKEEDGTYKYYLEDNISEFTADSFVYLIDKDNNSTIAKIKSINSNDKEFTFIKSDVLVGDDQQPNYLNDKEFEKIIKIGSNKDLLGIGINSSASQDKFLRPHGISFVEFNNLSNYSDNSFLRLFLGNLNTLEINNIEGYGLYGENVYLTGSLVTQTKSENSKNFTYAGVNTLNGVSVDEKTFKDMELPDNMGGGQDDSKIVFWAGAEDSTDISIQKAPFIVTEKGSIYCQQGRFKGTIITDSTIESSALKTAAIYGSGSAPALSIYDVNNGISFFKTKGTNEQKDTELLKITTSGFSLGYLEDGVQKFQNFIIFKDNEAYFNGKIEGLGDILQIGSLYFNGKSNQDYIGFIPSGVSSPIAKILFSTQDSDNTKGKIVLNNSLEIQEESIIFNKELYLGKNKKVNFKIIDNKNGYDLYVS